MIISKFERQRAYFAINNVDNGSVADPGLQFDQRCMLLIY